MELALFRFVDTACVHPKAGQPVFLGLVGTEIQLIISSVFLPSLLLNAFKGNLVIVEYTTAISATLAKLKNTLRNHEDSHCV